MTGSRNNNIMVIAILVLLIFIMAPFAHFIFFRIFRGLPPHFTTVMVQDMARSPLLMLPTILPLLLMGVVWLLVAVWVYYDAERKGMSGILWALLVFLGNLVGLVIYLIVRTDAVAPPPLVSKVCPECNGPVQPDFKVCPHCGSELGGTCPKCGKNVQDNWNICPYCGESLQK